MHKLALVALLTPPILAQSSFTLPKVFRDSYAPGGNLLPLARSKAFIQTWYHGQNLPVGTLVSQMGWRYDSGSSAAAPYTHTLEIVLDSSPVTATTFSNVFANNLSAAPTTFLPLQQVSFPAPPVGGLDPGLWIPGNVPFVFLGPNLIVQVDVQSEATPRTLSNFATDAILLAATSPYLNAAGPSGCAPSILSVSASGAGPVSLNFRLLNGPANSQAVFLVGTENHTLGGANILPLDLGFLGMPNCSLGVDPMLTLTLPTDGQGGALLQASLPHIANVTQTLFVQCAHAGSTPLGVVTTNYVGTTVGDVGLMNYAYNWDTFGPTSQYGPYPTDRGAVILMR